MAIKSTRPGGTHVVYGGRTSAAFNADRGSTHTGTGRNGALPYDRPKTQGYSDIVNPRGEDSSEYPTSGRTASYTVDQHDLPGI